MDKRRYARKIAARGLTPNDRGKFIRAKDATVYGRILYFDHFDSLTVIGVKPDNRDGIESSVEEYDFAHLDEITVYD